MSVQKFTAPTSREALDKARQAFGDRTLILSNRPIAGGVEVTAAAEDLTPATRGVRMEAASLSSPASANEASTVAQDTETLAMSTLSFQQYVRERLMLKRHEETAAQAPLSPSAAAPQPKPQTRLASPAKPLGDGSPFADESGMRNLHAEIRDLKASMEERFSAMTWLGEAQRRPQITGLMLKLAGAGYSSDLIRTLLLNFPEDLTNQQAIRRVASILTDNLPTVTGNASLLETGGIAAIVGASGVGKTTATAALAAKCVELHGAASVGIVTLDTLRPGAHEQLRHITREIGIVAHAAPDAEALQDLLQLWSGKHLVLIDTPGIMPNGQGLDSLRLTRQPGILQLLALNAAADGEVQNAFLKKMSVEANIAGVVLTRRDEALKLGPIINNLIRHRTPLLGSTLGQPTAQNWQAADAFQLVAQTLKAAGDLAFLPVKADLPLLFNQVGRPVLPLMTRAAPF